MMSDEPARGGGLDGCGARRRDDSRTDMKHWSVDSDVPCGRSSKVLVKCSRQRAPGDAGTSLELRGALRATAPHQAAPVPNWPAANRAFMLYRCRMSRGRLQLMRSASAVAADARTGAMLVLLRVCYRQTPLASILVRDGPAALMCYLSTVRLMHTPSTAGVNERS